MSDLISRKKAVQGVRELFSLGDCYCDELSIVGMLNGLSSAEPERKTGKWIKEDGSIYKYCSECHFYAVALSADELFKYCPHCGVDMRGER